MRFQEYLDSSFALEHVTYLTEEIIDLLQLQGLAVDFDGVLGGARSLEIDTICQPWFETLLRRGIRIAIHSNNPDDIGQIRKQRLLRDFPDILWFPPHPKKPNPSTLNYLKNRWHLDAAQIAMIDDRMLTGGLAAFRAGVRFIFIESAVSDYALAPILESGFAALRFLEKARYRAPAKWCIREDSNL